MSSPGVNYKKSGKGIIRNAGKDNFNKILPS